jgi:hypothetical protein
MTLRPLRWLLPVALVMLLSACVSAGGQLQTKGDVTAFDMTMTTQLDWARIKTRRNELWTIDGIALNRLIIFSKVKPGEHVFQLVRERKSRPDGPWYRAGMRLDELQKLVADGFTDQQWVNIQTGNLRPHTFGSVEGIRFDIEMTNPDGLIYKGTAAVAERNKLLNVIVWIAPKEYYHGRDVAAVESMLDGMRFK